MIEYWRIGPIEAIHANIGFNSILTSAKQHTEKKQIHVLVIYFISVTGTQAQIQVDVDWPMKTDHNCRIIHNNLILSEAAYEKNG